ncbi:MAG: hypothetical protein GY754_41230 [bacterium]|nr:hypothetical protein [bacterium]
MAINKDTIEINRPIKEVFDYKTNPAYWPNYHPLSVEVGPELQGPPVIGTEFYEVVNVLSIKQRFEWKVVKYSSPGLFEIAGSVKGFFGGDAVITYTLEEKGDKTLFTRRFEIKRYNAILKFLDWLMINRVADYDGKNALKNLKKIMEEKS